MKYFYLLNMLAILLVGCSGSQTNERNDTGPQTKEGNKNKNDIHYIDIEAAIKIKKEISLSEIASEISYIPLETRSDNLLNKISQLELTQSYIFVNDGKSLLQFTRDGKFLRHIGNIGRGPGEYSRIMQFSVSEATNTIILQSEFRINKYDLEGNFLKEIEKSSIGSRFLFYQYNRLASYYISDEYQPTNLIITDKDLTPLFSFKNYNPRPKTNTKFSTAPLYIFENKLYFKENFNDTVFCVDDSILIPHIIINEKELLFDKNLDLQTNVSVEEFLNQIEKVKNKSITKSIYESKKYVLISYQRGLREVKYTRVLFTKENTQTILLNDNGFINDIDGIGSFWPHFIYKDSLMVNYQEAFLLKEYVASSEFKNSTPKYPEKKKKLEQLANSLDENDNPVLMLVKLKE